LGREWRPFPSVGGLIALIVFLASRRPDRSGEPPVTMRAADLVQDFLDDTNGFADRWNGRRVIITDFRVAKSRGDWLRVDIDVPGLPQAWMLNGTFPGGVPAQAGPAIEGVVGNSFHFLENCRFVQS
jgi:hypothetical protein